MPPAARLLVAGRASRAAEPVEAVLYSPARPRFAQRLAGTCDFAKAQLQLHFLAASSRLLNGLAEDPELAPLFRELGVLAGGSELRLTIEDETAAGVLVRRGEQTLSFRFQVSSPERLAQLQQQEAEREARLLGLIRTGASFEGTADTPSLMYKGPVRLRFERVEPRGETIEAILQPVREVAPAVRLTGNLDLAAGVFALASRGFAWWPSQPRNPGGERIRHHAALHRGAGRDHGARDFGHRERPGLSAAEVTRVRACQFFFAALGFGGGDGLSGVPLSIT